MAGKTALSNCLLTRLPAGEARLLGLACKKRDCRLGARLCSSCPTIVLENIKYRCEDPFHQNTIIEWPMKMTQRSVQFSYEILCN